MNFSDWRTGADLKRLPMPLTREGEVPGRTGDDQITLFDSVGFATEDFSALRYIHDQLARTGFFIELDMLADPDDPRDLFGMVRRAS